MALSNSPNTQHQLVRGPFEMALSPKIPIPKESFESAKHLDKVFYRNDGNKEIKSRGF